MTLVADLQKLNQSSPLVELYTLDCTVLGGSVYRFTPQFAEGGTVSFGGITYTCLPIVSDGWEVGTSGTMPRPNLQLSNVHSELLAAVISLGDLVGAKVTRTITAAKYLDASSFIRWNLLQDSQNFAAATFHQTGGNTITSNSVLAPNGTLSGSTSNTAIGSGFYDVATTATNSTKYIASMYVKAGTVSTLNFELSNQNESAVAVYPFNLTTGTVGSVGSLSGFTSTSANIASVGGGWYRIRITGTTPSTGTTNVGLYPRWSSAGTMYIWGAQVEVGVSTTDEPTVYQYTASNSHQPYADSTQYLKPDVYFIEQKTSHTASLINFQLSSVLDLYGTKLPRRQITRDAFPGIGRGRGSW